MVCYQSEGLISTNVWINAFDDNGLRKYKGVCGNVIVRMSKPTLLPILFMWNRIEWSMDCRRPATTTPLGYTETSKSLERSGYTNDDLLTGVCGLSTLHPTTYRR